MPIQILYLKFTALEISIVHTERVLKTLNLDQDNDKTKVTKILAEVGCKKSETAVESKISLFKQMKNKKKQR